MGGRERSDRQGGEGWLGVSPFARRSEQGRGSREASRGRTRTKQKQNRKETGTQQNRKDGFEA